jgi:hypothetical protein
MTRGNYKKKIHHGDTEGTERRRRKTRSEMNTDAQDENQMNYSVHPVGPYVNSSPLPLRALRVSVVNLLVIFPKELTNAYTKSRGSGAVR